MERENQRVAISKRLLKEALLRLLEHKELEQIRVTDLCREAGINRTTFYRHYELPRDVLIELEKDLYHDLRQTVPLPRTAGEVEGCLQALCVYMEQRLPLIRVIVRCNTDADFAAFVMDIYRELWPELDQPWPWLGLALTEEDRKMVVLYGAGGSYFVLRHWMLGDLNKSAEEMADYLCRQVQKTDWTALGRRLGFGELPAEAAATEPGGAAKP